MDNITILMQMLKNGEFTGSASITDDELYQLAEELGHNIYPIKKLILNGTAYTPEDLKEQCPTNAIYLRDDKYSLIRVNGYYQFNEGEVTNSNGDKYNFDYASYYNMNNDWTYIVIRVEGIVPPFASVETRSLETEVENDSAELLINLWGNFE